jgi:soluble cytochrome b562
LLKSFNETTRHLSYVHDYGKNELDILKKDTSALSLAIADSTTTILVQDDPGVGGMLKINLYSYRKTGRTGKRGSYAKKKRHDRQYLLTKRRRVKKDFELFQVESPDRLCTGVFHFDQLKQCPKTPHVALDKVFQWLDSNNYLDPKKFCAWAEYGDNRAMHVHFLACLKPGLKFDSNSHNSILAKTIQSSWSYGYASVNPQPYQLERLANYWVAIPEVEQKPYGELSDSQMVALRDSIAHEIEQWQNLPDTPKNKGKIAGLKDRKKEVQKQIKQGRATWYPNSKIDNPYRSSLSGFQSKKLNVTTDQARTLARLGKFSHAKLSAKALTNVNPSTGEISNGPVLATVSLFLKLSPEEVQQALRLKPGFELNDALNHKS